MLLLLGALPAFAQAPAIVVGAAIPQSGILADLAADLRKALLLWQEEVNAGGGLDGRAVELKLLDDRSESLDAGRLYDQLILEHKADLLIGPLGSAATLGAAGAAERNRRVMVNGTGAARAVQKAGNRYVFQSAAPLSSYGAGALELARSQGLKRIVLLARDDPGAREMAARTREAAIQQGFGVGGVETYPAGADDFLPMVARARAAGAEAWIAFGLPQDAAAMVKALQKTGYAPRVFVAQGAAQADFVARLGQMAEYAVGIAAYDARARTHGNAGFVQAYCKEVVRRARRDRRRGLRRGQAARGGRAPRGILRPGETARGALRAGHGNADRRLQGGALGRAGRRAGAAHAGAARPARGGLARGLRDGEMAALSRLGRAQAAAMSA